MSNVIFQWIHRDVSFQIVVYRFDIPHIQSLLTPLVAGAVLVLTAGHGSGGRPADEPVSPDARQPHRHAEKLTDVSFALSEAGQHQQHVL